MEKSNLLRKIYSVNKIAEFFSCIYKNDYEIYSSKITDLIRIEIEKLRKDIIEDKIISIPEIEELTNKIKARLNFEIENNLKIVINATGIILNTNLGRNIFSEEIAKKTAEFLSNYSNLEYDLEEGKRGSRQDFIKNILKEITHTEDCFIVNNNAAAVFLICNTFANQKEVLVSRGELVEIGESFRLQDIIKTSGSKLVEVGSTNKTKINDYLDNITENTSLIIKSYTSNYKIIGFTAEVNSTELAKIGKEKNILTYEDIGSGLLIEPSYLNLKEEPYILDKINSGIDLISFSGDKLLGAGQAGIILGKKSLIDKIKKNPLARTVRIDKVNLFLLESVLKEYLKNPKYLVKDIPIFNMINLSYDDLLAKSKELIDKLENKNITIKIEDNFSFVGGGSLPDYQIKTPVIKISSHKKSINIIQKELRALKIPLIAKIENDFLIINLRTVLEKQYNNLVDNINFVLNS